MFLLNLIIFLFFTEVICKQCNHCRDIDLCKDPHVSEVADTPVWVCASGNNFFKNFSLVFFFTKQTILHKLLLQVHNQTLYNKTIKN